MGFNHIENRNSSLGQPAPNLVIESRPLDSIRRLDSDISFSRVPGGAYAMCRFHYYRKTNVENLACAVYLRI